MLLPSLHQRRGSGIFGNGFRIYPQQVTQERMERTNGHVVVSEAAELPMQQKENIRQITHGLSWDFGFIQPQTLRANIPETALVLLINEQ
jgi:hypothetical protein